MSPSLVLISCSEKMAEVKLVGPDAVTVRDSAWFRCEVDGVVPPLTFQWLCNKGRLREVEDSRDSVQWFAPDSSGGAVINVMIVDSQGKSARDSLVVTINPLVKSFINWDGAVKSGGYFFWGDSGWQGYRLAGWSSGDTGTTYLLFMDEVNFLKWREGASYQYLIRRWAYNRSPFYDTLPATGLYYLVIDNIRNNKDCNFWVVIWLTSP